MLKIFGKNKLIWYPAICYYTCLLRLLVKNNVYTLMF